MSSGHKFECEHCGKQEYVLMDGYAFGDRLLEGVKFQVRATSDDQLSVKIDPQSVPYFEKLNMKKWLKEAKVFAEQNDAFECPTCGDDCYLEEGDG